MDVEDNENRRLIFIIMKGILTPEEKQYLRRTSNYLRSLGMKEGLIEFEMQNDEDKIYHEDIRWQDITTFSNNYSADIPKPLYVIFKKIIKYVDSLNNLNNDIDNITWQRIELKIDCERREIVVTHEMLYYGEGDENSIDFDEKEDIKKFNEWVSEDLKDVEVPSNGYLTIRYNGAGDSGYLENSFDETNDVVPSLIEDWCYRQLETHFGGWEINEGSDGKFVFNFNDSTVYLHHVFNTEEQQFDTLYEESFNQ